MEANKMADTAMISEMRVKGVRHSTPERRKIAVMSEPTKLIATKKTKLEMYMPHDA